MRKSSPHAGYAMIVLLIMLLLGGIAASHIASSSTLQHALRLEQHVRESQILEHIRSDLLSFAANQGIHSQSHLGHLPCPSLSPDGIPQTTCLDKPWAYLPLRSKASINYLNPGINARNNELASSANRHWQYAVSVQLLQPNALGWSRWVDYSKPAIQIRILGENNLIEKNVAAVVAQSIEPTGENQYDVTPPFTLIRVNELNAHMTQVQLQLIKDTLNTWLQTPGKNTGNLSQENLSPVPGLNNTYTPVNSNCTCRCTKTRCSCNCDEPGQWTSDSACLAGNPQCINRNIHTGEPSACTSTPSSAPCVFLGPAALKSQWPVSRFEPVAASNKSCRPSNRKQCPLSKDNTPCTCDFSWPDNTKTNLAHFEVNQSPENRVLVKPADVQKGPR